NTRPAISFYNDNNPDWLNVMIFYHVLGHIDFFQNNLFFKNTWEFDLTGKALSDKRVIARYRTEKGRWVDYVIEFTRSIDNLVNYHGEINDAIIFPDRKKFNKVDCYFDFFLQKEKKVSINDYLKEIKRYNDCEKDHGDSSDAFFFEEVLSKYPEFAEFYKLLKEKQKEKEHLDVIQYIIRHSPFLKEDENKWMKSVMEIVRQTSNYFQPQIRTKIMNEGWASFWHETLFMKDERINGHEVDFAKVNASVTAMPKIGLNPYALGLRLFSHVLNMEDRGCFDLEYFMLDCEHEKKHFNKSKNTGMDYIFNIRENLCDFSFVNRYIDQEFINKHNLFVSGQRINKRKMTREYYVKSRRADAYKQMIIDTLYHPPVIYVDKEKSKQGVLYLVHKFEEKPLKKDFIENTMIGIEFLWGSTVKLETHEVVNKKTTKESYVNFWDPNYQKSDSIAKEQYVWKKTLYIIENRKLQKREI
ncbi:MAG: SpoVR family protein, partial [Desulfobacterales bacterium]|nr:SpoVR family protein [Desulfobacterales bacterium]